MTAERSCSPKRQNWHALACNGRSSPARPGARRAAAAYGGAWLRRSWLWLTGSAPARPRPTPEARVPRSENPPVSFAAKRHAGAPAVGEGHKKTRQRVSFENRWRVTQRTTSLRMNRPWLLRRPCIRHVSVGVSHEHLTHHERVRRAHVVVGPRLVKRERSRSACIQQTGIPP
jgi:hypothetical protein